VSFPSCPRCGGPMKPRHRRNRHGLWVDDGYECHSCRRRFSSMDLRVEYRNKLSIDTQAEKFVKAHIRRQKRAARLAGQIPVVEER